MDSNSEITLTLDIGVFASAGVDLGNIGLGDNLRQGNRKFTKICVQREGRNFPFAFEFDEPFLGKLAVEFSGKQLLVLKSMTRERITKETLKAL